LKRSSLPYVAPGHCASRVCFLGAVHGNVTGSMHLVELHEHNKVTRILIDVGQTVDDPRLDFQNRLRDGLTFKDIDIVIITHAHLDHSGLAPLMYKQGFRGKVYVTGATGDLMEIMLPDSGKIQESDALRENLRAVRKEAERISQAAPAGANSNTQPEATEDQKRKTSGKQQRPAARKPQAVPLYTQEDAVQSLNLLERLRFVERYEIAPGVRLRFLPASHILGAAMVHLELGWNGEKRTCLFAGNIGHKGMALLRDIGYTLPADYVFMESTYGDRVHQVTDDLVDLSTILNDALERASNTSKRGFGAIVIPVFSVGRSQTMLDRIRRLKESGRLPKGLKVYLDSPMSIKVTDVHRREEHRQLLNDETQSLFASGRDPFRFPGLVEVAEFRKELLEPLTEPAIFLCSPGMGNGGRALSQLDARLGSDNNTVVFVGYQGRGTIGGALLDIRNSLLAAAKEGGASRRAPAKTLSIMGRKRRVNAKIEFMPHYSAHGDQQDIIRLLASLAAQRRPKMVFVEHGDQGAVDALEEKITQVLNLKATQPKLKEWYLL
jgi:metallo-beta-lactamase family protein